MFGFLPSNVFTTHMGQGSGTGPSPRILACVAGQAQAPDGSERLYEGFADDFDGQVTSSGTAGAILGRNTFYSDTGGSLASDNTDIGGVLSIVTSTTDNHESWLKSGVVGKLDALPFFFECRANIPTAAGTVFLGLTAPGVAAADVMADDDSTPDANFFGFKINSGTITFVSRKSGSAEVVLSSTELGSATGWHKLGFAWTPRKSSSVGRLTLYKDNVAVLTLDDTDLTTTTSLDKTPSAVPLAAIFGHKNTAAAAVTTKLDWAYAMTLAA